MGDIFKRKGMAVFLLAWLMVIVAIGSSILTLLLIDGGSGTGRLHLVSASEKEALDRYARLEEIYDTLMQDYYQELDEDTLVTGAIRGMMNAVGDPYTFYYTAEEMTEHQEDDRGIFHGIGVTVTLQKGGGIEVVQVYEDSPAQAAGLQEGDIIMAVEGEDVSAESGKSLNDVVALIKGEDGTAVKLTVLRDGEEMEIVSLRGQVNVQYAQFEILDGHIGYLTISQFTGNAAEGVEKAIRALQNAGVDGLIVDVRDNPGGTLDQVLEITDAFLPECMIVYIEDRAGARREYYSDAEYWDIPMAVLVNGGSASASEIFAAAMKENDRGVIIGETTFGKGIVQTLISFTQDGAGMQYTSDSYYTPDGNSIHGAGVQPDIEILPGEGEEDAQLQAAIQALYGE